MLEKIKRLRQSIKGESNKEIAITLKAVMAGMTNFTLGISSAKKLAEKRYKDYCSGCEYNTKEQVKELIVEDEDIPQLSGRSCADCGCVLSYKLRQNIKQCRKWK